MKRGIARADELQRAENQRALLSDLSANATEQLKIQLDVKCGLRPASPGSLPYGFTDLRSDYGCGPSDAGFNGRPRMEGDGQTQDPTPIAPLCGRRDRIFGEGTQPCGNRTPLHCWTLLYESWSQASRSRRPSSGRGK